MKKAKIVLIVTGMVSVFLGCIGLLYNLTTLFTDFSDVPKEIDAPYFYPAFYMMSVICICCFIGLIVCGIQFVRFKTGVFKSFVAILIFEIMYITLVGMLWCITADGTLAMEVGMSVGAATGVANGGLVCQGLVLFPLWAPFLAWWGTKRIRQGEVLVKKSE